MVTLVTASGAISAEISRRMGTKSVSVTATFFSRV
jgi:hypothetical protein